MTPADYWEECISNAAQECGVKLTREQLWTIADAAMHGHDHYGHAFPEPAPEARFIEMQQRVEKDIERHRKEIADHEAQNRSSAGERLRYHAEASAFACSLIPLNR